jgi:hypothetical protein
MADRPFGYVLQLSLRGYREPLKSHREKRKKEAQPEALLNEAS